MRFRNLSHSASEIFSSSGSFAVRFDDFADAFLPRALVDEVAEAFLVRRLVDEVAEAFLRDEV